ncbi:MAG: PLP-dependent transferase, partial [Alphaproteobacteria bacterium]
LAFGADIVVYSATKHIDGQGRCLGGAVLGYKDFISEVLHPYLRNTGPSLSPFNAWLLLKGLETLHLRIERQCQTAAEVAVYLAKQSTLQNVLYPFSDTHPQRDLARRQMRQGGSMVSFEIKGGKESVFRFLNALNLIRLSNNLGDSKTLITHPATTTHARLTPEARAAIGISDGLVRLSIGLESSKDLLVDLDQALRKA